MIPQMVLSPEGFTTDITRVRSLVSMRTFMNQQVITLGKLSVAKFTNKLLLRPGGPPGRPQQPPVQVRMHLRRSRLEQGAAARERKRSTSRIVGQESRIARMGLRRRGRLQQSRRRSGSMGEHQSGGVSGGNARRAFSLQLQLFSLVVHHHHQLETRRLPGINRRRAVTAFARVASLVAQEEGMHVGGVQHGVHVSGGYDRDEGGRLSVVAHGGRKGELVVVGDLGVITGSCAASGRAPGAASG
jgi:hypothetical protein